MCGNQRFAGYTVTIPRPQETGQISDICTKISICLSMNTSAVAAARALKSVRGWEVRRTCTSRHVGIAGGVHGDATTEVSPTAAEVGGVDERGACGIQLRNERISAAGGLESARRSGEIA